MAYKARTSVPSLEVHNLPFNATSSGREFTARELAQLVNNGITAALYSDNAIHAMNPIKARYRLPVADYSFFTNQRVGAYFYDRIARRLPYAPEHPANVDAPPGTVNYPVETELPFILDYARDLAAPPDDIRDDKTVREHLLEEHGPGVTKVLPLIFEWYYTYHFALPMRATYDCTATRLFCITILYTQIRYQMQVPSYAEILRRNAPPAPTPARIRVFPAAVCERVLQENAGCVRTSLAVLQGLTPALQGDDVAAHHLRDGTPVTHDDVARIQTALREPQGGGTKPKYRPRDRTGRRFLEHAAEVPQSEGSSFKRKDVVVNYRRKLSSFGVVVEFGRRFDLNNDGHVSRLLDLYSDYWRSIQVRARQGSVRKDVHLCEWYRAHEHRPVFCKLLQLLGHPTARYIIRLIRMKATAAERRDFHLVPQMESSPAKHEPLPYPEYDAAPLSWSQRFRRAVGRPLLTTLKGAVTLGAAAAAGVRRVPQLLGTAAAEAKDVLHDIHDGSSHLAARFRAAVLRALSFITLPVDFFRGGLASLYDTLSTLVEKVVNDKLKGMLTSVVGITVMATISLALSLLLIGFVCKKLLPSVWQTMWSSLGSVVNTMGLTRIYNHFFQGGSTGADDLEPQIGGDLTEGGFFSFVSGVFSAAAGKAAVAWHAVGETLPRWKRLGDAVEWFVARIPKWWAWVVSWYTGNPVPFSPEEEEVHTLHVELGTFYAKVMGAGGCLTAFNADPDLSTAALALCERHFLLLRRYGPGGSRITPAFVLMLRNDQTTVDALRKGVMAHRASAAVRSVPVWLHISGENNQGKSTFVNELLPRLKATLREIHPDKKRYSTPFTNGDLYTLRPRDGFWDNYAGQPFVLADDLFQVSDEKERAQVASDFMTIIGPQTCPLMVADPAHKGVTYFTSDFIITTSNVANISAVGISTPEGLWQRQFMHLRMSRRQFRFQSIWDKVPKYYKVVDGQRTLITKPTVEDIVGLLAARCVEAYHTARAAPDVTPVLGEYCAVTPRYRSFEEDLPTISNFRYTAGALQHQSGKEELSDSDDESSSDDEGRPEIKAFESRDRFATSKDPSAPLSGDAWSKTYEWHTGRSHYKSLTLAQCKIATYLVQYAKINEAAAELFLEGMPHSDRACKAHAHLRTADFVSDLTEAEMDQIFEYCTFFEGRYALWFYNFLAVPVSSVATGWSPTAIWRVFRSCPVDFDLCQFPRVGLRGAMAAYQRYVQCGEYPSPLTYSEFILWGQQWQRARFLAKCSLVFMGAVTVAGVIGTMVATFMGNTGLPTTMSEQSGSFAGNIKKRERVFARHLPNLNPRVVGRGIQPQARYDDWLAKCMRNSRQVTIQHEHGKNDTFYAFGVFGNVIMVARHCSDAFGPGDVLILNADFDGSPQSFQYEQTNVIELGSACDHEVTFIVLSTMRNYFPSLLTHFTDTVRASGVVVRGRRTPVKDQILSEVLSSKSFEVLPDDIVDGRYVNHARNGGLMVYGLENANGYCGLPYFHPQSSDGPAILGIHVAGNPTTKVNSVARVTKHMVQAAFETWEKHFGPHTGDPQPREDLELGLTDQIARVPGTQVLGQLPSKFIARLPTRSRLIMTDLHPASRHHDASLDLRHVPQRRPCSAAPYETPQGWINPLRAQLRKWGEIKGEANVGGVWLEEWHLLADKSLLLPPDFNASRCRLLSPEEAIDGCDGVEGMDMTTSSGFPYTLQGKSRRSVLHRANRPSPEFCERVRALEKMLESGPRPMVVIDYPKDELIPFADYDNGKCRLFCAGELDYVALTRMYFATFLLEMEQAPFATPISIGINPHSSQWTYLYRRLRKHPNVGAGDFSGQEFTIPHTMAGAFTDFCEFAFPLPERETRIRRHLVLSIIHVIHLIFGIAFAIQRGEGSGHPLTAFFNSFCTWSFFFAAWVHLGKDPKEFKNHVELAVMGDDSVVSVSDAHRDFNMFAWAEFAALIGMRYTPASKGAVVQAYQDWAEIDYLKRRFVERDGWVFAPLAWPSIIEMAMWVKDNSPDQDDDILSSLQSMMLELRHYPQSQYAFYNEIARKWCLKHKRSWNHVPFRTAVSLMQIQ